MGQFFEENPPDKPLSASRRKPRILIAPLDWGLGHATRCIPIIREILNQGIEVWLAGEDAQEKLPAEQEKVARGPARLMHRLRGDPLPTCVWSQRGVTR